MTGQPSLFDQDNRSKRATRYKLEFADTVTGAVLWDALVTEQPHVEILTALRARGIKVRRPVVKGDANDLLVFSRLDPDASIVAAREAHARRATKRSAVLMRLLQADGGWVTRTDVRDVGGDSGDRRVRELRQVGWPIEIAQQREGQAWACRLRI